MTDNSKEASMSEIKPVSIKTAEERRQYRLQNEIDLLKAHLAVVRRLQSKIDSLESATKSDGEYIVALAREAREAKERSESSYDCGEL